MVFDKLFYVSDCFFFDFFCKIFEEVSSIYLFLRLNVHFLAKSKTKTAINQSNVSFLHKLYGISCVVVQIDSDSVLYEHTHTLCMYAIDFIGSERARERERETIKRQKCSINCYYKITDHIIVGNWNI